LVRTLEWRGFLARGGEKFSLEQGRDNFEQEVAERTEQGRSLHFRRE
jgi:hypothetical protein